MGRSIEQLANQQVLKWLAGRKEADSRVSYEPPPDSRTPRSAWRVAQRPMITISREYGAYGGEMGKIVARALKIEFYAQELVQEIAKHADVREQVVQALDERSQGSLRLWIDDLITIRKFEMTDYLTALSETIGAISRHSRGVIVGRGAHLILEPARTLRVRVFAPRERRAEYVAEREGMSLAEAKIKVDRVDRERHEFFEKNFGVEVSDVRGFDLTINTSSFSLEAGAQVVAEAYRQRFG
jgi:cytidylate kinase